MVLDRPTALRTNRCRWHAAPPTLDQAGVKDLLRRECRAPTGSVVQIPFAGAERLMVADPGANTLVDEEGPADGVTDFAARATVVFVSGYVMTAPARAAQVWQLVALARSHGATVVLDVVPHRVEQLAPSLLGLLESVDAVMGEARTLHHLYGPGGMPASGTRGDGGSGAQDSPGTSASRRAPVQRP